MDWQAIGTASRSGDTRNDRGTRPAYRPRPMVADHIVGVYEAQIADPRHVRAAYHLPATLSRVRSGATASALARKREVLRPAPPALLWVNIWVNIVFSTLLGVRRYSR